jgi:hypothetical protein
MQYECMMSCNVGPIHSLPKEKRLTKYRWRTCSRWQFALISIVSSSGMTYINVVSIHAEVHNIYDIHHPIERYLPYYLVVGVSLQKVNYRR